MDYFVQVTANTVETEVAMAVTREEEEVTKAMEVVTKEVEAVTKAVGVVVVGTKVVFLRNKEEVPIRDLLLEGIMAETKARLQGAIRQFQGVIQQFQGAITPPRGHLLMHSNSEL